MPKTDCNKHKISEDVSEDFLCWRDLNDKLKHIIDPSSRATTACPLCILEYLSKLTNTITGEKARKVIEAYNNLREAEAEYNEVFKTCDDVKELKKNNDAIASLDITGEEEEEKEKGITAVPYKEIFNKYSSKSTRELEEKDLPF